MDSAYLQWLRYRRRTPTCLIVILTGQVDEALVAEILRQGARAYLVKTHMDGYAIRRNSVTIKMVRYILLHSFTETFS